MRWSVPVLLLAHGSTSWEVPARRRFSAGGCRRSGCRRYGPWLLGVGPLCSPEPWSSGPLSSPLRRPWWRRRWPRRLPLTRRPYPPVLRRLHRPTSPRRGPNAPSSRAGTSRSRGCAAGVEGAVMPQHRRHPSRQVHEGDGHQQLPDQVLRGFEGGDSGEVLQKGEGQGHGDELDRLLEHRRHEQA